jgi:hypothetical protein
MKNSTIRLRDDETDLSAYKIGDECDIKIKGIMKGAKEEQDYGDSPVPVSPGKKSPEPKKYIEYTIEVKKVQSKEPEKDGDFFNKDKRVEYGSTKRSGE